MSLYGLIDTTRDERLYPWLLSTPESQSLFGGRLEPVLQKASPYIAQLKAGDPLLEAWCGEGWGHSWGILCRSHLSLANLRRHLRHFLQVQLPDGDIVLFRFYDPRVWRAYFPTCNSLEREMWLEDVEEYICEENNGIDALRFGRRGVELSKSIDFLRQS
jgi:hypothetical protein